MRFLFLPTFAVLNCLQSIFGLTWPISSTKCRHQKIISRRHSTSMFTSNDAIIADDENSFTDAYLGPESDFDSMEAGCSIEDLGIQVMVGPSLIGSGRGLFISILDDVDEVILPAGTPICGYSKGAFTKEADGDKSVAYLFSSPYTGILFEKKLMPLLDAIGIVEDRINNATANAKPSAFKSINAKKKYKIADGVVGHKISYDENKKEIAIDPDFDYIDRYFIPFEESESDVWGPGRLGMYANDLAYHEGATEESYNRNSPELNVLQITWRMELLDQTLRPTWPVVITLTDVLLKNREPMELGLQYSWRYWKSVQEAIAESENANDINAATPQSGIRDGNL